MMNDERAEHIVTAIFFLLMTLVVLPFAHSQTLIARMVAGVNPQTGVTYTFAPADAANLVTFANTNPVAVTLPSGSTANYGLGHIFAAQNLGPGVVTITCSGCQILSNGAGSSTLVLTAGQGADLWSAGGNYSAVTGTSSGISGSGQPNNFTGWVTSSTLGTAPCGFSGNDTLCKGLMAVANDGVHSGALAAVGNTVPPANIPATAYFFITGFASTSATSYGFTPNITPPTTGQYLVAGTPATCSTNSATCIPLNYSAATTISGTTSQKSETATADTNVLTITPASAAGTYRACVVISVSAATSGVISWTLSWTDSNGNARSNIAQDLFQQGTAAPNTTFTTSAAGNYNGCTTFDINNAGASIVVKWVGGGTTTAKMSATVEELI